MQIYVAGFVALQRSRLVRSTCTRKNFLAWSMCKFRYMEGREGISDIYIDL